MDNLRKEVLTLCDGTSDKYVPEPTKEQITENIILALRRYKNSCRWKEFWRDLKKKNRKHTDLALAKISENLDASGLDSDSNFIDAKNKFKNVTNIGLGTDLKPTDYAPPTPKRTARLEAFLSHLEKDILNFIEKTKMPEPTQKDQKISKLQKKLRESNF